MTTLEPSKRPFRHPVPAEAVPWFCHPWDKHHYHAPVWGEDARLYACNGWVAARFFNFPPDMAQGPPETLERLHALNWHNSRWEAKDAWRKTDDCTLDLFQDGVLPMWQLVNRRLRFHWRPFVRVNHGLLIPAVSLQLISRLPACEIYTGAGRSVPVAFRFKGGEGLLGCLSHNQETAATDEPGGQLCHIFAT